MENLTRTYPIWFDRSYFIPEGPYTIRQGGKVIYSGYAKAQNENSGGVTIYIKSIIMNYLLPDLRIGDNGEYTHNSNQTRVFELYVEEESEPLYEITVWLDWSYSYDTMNNLINNGANNGGIISQPINYHWNKSQIIPVSFFESSDLNEWQYHYMTNQGENTVDLDVYTENNFVSTLTIKPYQDGMNTFRITNGGENVMEWKPEDERCAYGALYYINQYGGWDSFLLEYNISEKQDIDRQEWSTGADWFSGDFDYQYLNKSIKYTYTTNTGWLTDNQSKLLYDHLFASPVIYFQNFNDEEPYRLFPVNLTKTSWTKKEFKNGKHLISYELEFKTSNIKQRQ